MSRSDRPPGRGGGWSESTDDWRTSQLVGSRLPARCHAPGARDIVLSSLKRLVGKPDHKQLGRT